MEDWKPQVGEEVEVVSNYCNAHVPGNWDAKLQPGDRVVVDSVTETRIRYKMRNDWNYLPFTSIKPVTPVIAKKPAKRRNLIRD